MQKLITSLIFKMLVSKGKEEIKKLEEISQNPLSGNVDLLLRILRQNKDTEYGRKYNFADIQSFEDYAAKVPFTNYDSYAQYIDEMKKGNDGFITSIPPVAFAATSGSVANPKAIPVSKETIATYKAYGSAYGFAVIDRDLKGAWKHNKMLNLMEVKSKETPCGKKYGAISGIAVNSIKNLLPFLMTTPLECVFPQENMDSMYIHARFALEYKELSGILSSFMTIAIDCLNYIKTHWELLADDIEKGIINEEINIPDQTRAALMKRIKPHPERARELRREFQLGFDSTILKRIWPQLAFIYAIGSGGFSAYTKKLKEYAGDIPIFHSFFAASEAMMATCTVINKDHYALLPRSVFFEFIPAENVQDKHPETLTLDRLEVGKSYEIVLTTTSGFYRYRISDVVKVVGMYNNCPEIQFSYRLNQMVSLAGEKTNDEHFRWAISELEKETGCGISEYSVYPDTNMAVGKYVILLEPRSQEAFDTLIRNGKTVDILQEKLSIANPSFGSKIKTGTLGNVDVKYAQQQTYALYRDLMAMRGVSPNQIKPVRVIDTPEKENFFFSLLEREMNMAP